MIRFLEHQNINREAWDDCIKNSKQALIYGYSWYLDLVSPGWCGLEADNYSKVMPLPVKTKFGIQYIMQPLYAQQFGVFSKNEIKSEEISEFINTIPENFRYIALNLNFDNIYKVQSIKMNSNFELNLDKEYTSIASSYSSNTRRNLAKSASLDINFNDSIENLLELKKDNTGKNRRKIPLEVIRIFIETIKEYSSGFICSAVDSNKTCASAFFMKDKNRIYYLIPVSDPIGKEKKAMFAIIDEVIKKYSNSSYTLDFEGSNIPGIARFCQGFGAIDHPYPTLRINRLPFPFNKLKN